jgi:uncharacterized protein YwgA
MSPSCNPDRILSMEQLRQIFEDLEDEEKIILYALGALNGTPIRSKTKLQKLLFLVSNVFENYKDLLEFEPHFFGPYSETVDTVLDDLVSLGLVKKGGNKYSLTSEGFYIYDNLRPKKELKYVIDDFKVFLNDLPQDELLAFIYVTYPRYTEESAKWNKIQANRKKIAVSLLRKHKVSFGKAVEISGLSSSEFNN